MWAIKNVSRMKTGDDRKGDGEVNALSMFER